MLETSVRLARRNVELPTAWARSHGDVVVAFDRYSETNWHAHLVSTDGEVLLAFPWHDHADRILLDSEKELSVHADRSFPIQSADGVWESRDEGWWAWVKADGAHVYLAGCDGDEIQKIRRARKLDLRGLGLVMVDGVAFTWNRVPRVAYDRAWQDAIDTCHTGQPSPVGEWASVASEDRRVRLLA